MNRILTVTDEDESLIPEFLEFDEVVTDRDWTERNNDPVFNPSSLKVILG